MSAADAAGFTVHVHAIGDRAVRSTLDAFADARRRNGVHDNRDQIAHLELIDPEDFARFKELGVIANFQLLWATRESYITSATLPYLGPERSRHLYPARSLRDAGALLAAGSDWSVSSFNPFEAMEHAITRREDRGQEPLLPEQSISIQDIVDAYTINAAFALKQERTTGSLEPGKRADFIVLDRDIFAIDPLRSARHPGALDLPRRARGLLGEALRPAAPARGAATRAARIRTGTAISGGTRPSRPPPCLRA